MWPSSPVPPCCCRVWCAAGLPLPRIFSCCCRVWCAAGLLLPRIFSCCCRVWCAAGLPLPRIFSCFLQKRASLQYVFGRLVFKTAVVRLVSYHLSEKTKWKGRRKTLALCMPVFFLTLKIQASRHKVGALMALFSRLLNVSILTQKYINRLKSFWLFFLFCSNLIDIDLTFLRLGFPLNVPTERKTENCGNWTHSVDGIPWWFIQITLRITASIRR